MTGRLVVVGLGPGSSAQVTPEALAAVEASEDFFG
jgi:precorrin-3B C17-methyltransferase